MVSTRTTPLTIVARIVVTAGVIGGGVLIGAGSASAHDPIFFSDDQTTPETGPLLPDGTISFALYGALRAPGDTRGFQVMFEEGDELYVSLLIPNLLPENALPPDQLPMLTITAPDGTVAKYGATQAEVFDEPFSKTSYVELTEQIGVAQAGVYDMVVTAPDPLRFSVAVGRTETFGTPAERVVDRPPSVIQAAAPLQAWYGTTATGEPVPDAAVDLDEEGLGEAAGMPAAATTVPPATAPATTASARSAPVETESPAPTTAEGSVPADGADGDGESSRTPLIVGVVVGLVALLAIAYALARRRRAATTSTP